MFSSEIALKDRQRGRELVSRSGWVSRTCGCIGEVEAGFYCLRMVRAENPLKDQ